MSFNLLRPFLRTAPRSTLPISSQRFASGDYGSGSGDPKGEKPQDQGKNQESRELEHPGPPPPKAAQGKGEGSQQKTSSSSSSSSSSKPASGKGTQGAQPKILNDKPPAKDASEDVKKHNEEMDNRAEKAHEQVDNGDAKKDEVDKDFWSGQGGRDKDP